jgi:kexin
VTSYNVYWSTTAGVNETNGTKIAFVKNPWAHTGLPNDGTAYYYVVTAVNINGESVVSAQVSATPAAAAAAVDPLYADQWHLDNTGILGGITGEDINVDTVWATYKGTGIRIAVVDDGLEIGHEDLASNIAATGLSYNYLNGGTDPTEDPADVTPGNGHGTAVAGIVASRDLNGLGGRGVAPLANMVGYNFLQNSTVSNEADAMTRGSPDVHINTNSWAPAGGSGTLYVSNTAWRTAINTGLVSGRGGRGTIYTFAAGNGGTVIPTVCPTGCNNSNYNGYANNRGVIAVAAVHHDGIKSSYSEQGANLWVSAPAGEFCNTRTITTTDRTGGTVGFNLTGTLGDYGDPDSAYAAGNRNYTRCMNGTSAATPVVAGVVALMLEANPLLGWRDVRLILAQSARRNNTLDAGWVTAPAPYDEYNHKYGFGVVDAQAAVTLASTWVNIGPELTLTTPLSSPTVAIPDNDAVTGVSNSITVAASGITSIEFVEITFSALDHTYSGDLEITLTSPTGAVSRLAETHACSPCTPHNGWVFGSARHLGEGADGNWTLTVKDLVTDDTGTFQSWRLKFYGG